MAKIKGQLEQAQIENLTADPANLPEGRVFANTTSKRAKVVLNSVTETVVTEAQTQTVTNKTFTSPTINGGTIVAPAISDPTITKNTYAFNLPTLTSATTALTTDVTQVVTNKDIDGGTASNTNRQTLPKNTSANLAGLTRKQGTLVYDTTLGKPVYDDGTTLTAIGSGSGGSINFIDNGDAELTTNIFTGYTSGTVGARPAGTQTGGAANFTATRTTTTPLYKNASWLLSKSAVNAQGQNLSIPFTVDPAFRGKAIQITIDDIVDSGTFVAGSATTDSDCIVYIYDVTNSTFIEPSNFKFLSNSTTLAERFTANFQTSSNGSSYRLVFHVASTSAVAWALKVDNIQVSPSTYVYGTPVTDWASYTPTFSGFGTVSTQAFRSRRVGDSLEVQGALIFGTTTAAQAQISVGYAGASGNVTIDTSKLGTTVNNIVGSMAYNQSSASSVNVLAPTTNQTYVLLGVQNAGSVGTTPVTGSSFGTGASMSVFFSVPILGWSSAVQTSDTTDTRIVDFKGKATAATASGSNIAFATVQKDSHGAFASGVFTVPVAGDYNVAASIPTTNSANGVGELLVYVNGSLYDVIARSATNASVTAYIVSGAAIVPNLKVGDTISIRIAGYTNTVVQSAGSTDATNYGTLSISRISGPSAIAATELIAASYWVSANFAASSTVPINFDSKEFDTHNAVTPSATVWKFTAPAAGTYSVSIAALYSGGTFTAYLAKNGTNYKNMASALSTINGAGTVILKLVAGDYIDVRLSGGNTISGGALNGSNTCTINIHRVGL